MYCSFQIFSVSLWAILLSQLDAALQAILQSITLDLDLDFSFIELGCKIKHAKLIFSHKNPCYKCLPPLIAKTMLN